MQALIGDATSQHDLDSSLPPPFPPHTISPSPRLTYATAADYDPVAHLNAIFSHPATLSSAPDVSSKLSSHSQSLDASIADLSARRAVEDAASLSRMRQAQAELSTLFSKIDRLRERAQDTEKMITAMTADIKRLDGTKKNLTLSMTALKRLQMLTTAYEQLRGLSRGRQYRECASLLAAVIQLMAHFKSYRSIEQIATLSRKVAEIQRELLEQVCEDFEDAFGKDEVHKQRSVLAEGCLVVDALGENAKARLVQWYCNTSLKEYRNIFRSNDEAGSLDNISRRYAWFNRILKTYDAEHAPIFPAHWRVNELLANSFCQSTRDDFRSILQKSARRENGRTLDVSLLLSCLQETLDFEHSLEQRFGADSRRSVDTLTSADDTKPHAFEQAISEAFEPYLSLWVEAQDRALDALIPVYKARPIRADDDEDVHPATVLPSAGELFGVYRVDLAQCAKLSTGSRLLELSKVFGKYLDAYAQRVLFHHLSSPGPAGPAIQDTVILLNTADYCYTTTTQLEEKIKSRIDPDLRASVDLQSQADAFMGTASSAVRALARRVDAAAEPGWREMRAAAWSRLENVRDRSPFVPELQRAVRDAAVPIYQSLSHKPAYARAFGDALIDGLVAAFLANINAAKPISEPAAEQLLLDLHSLRGTLATLPSLSTDPPSPVPATYTKRVTTAFARPEPLLKTLQVRPDPPEALVQAYLIHIADGSEANFRTLLDIKGIARRPDQAPLVALFAAHKAAAADGLAASSPLLASFAAGNSAGATMPAAGGGAATAAAGLGSALFSVAAAASAGSSPVPSAGPSRVASPPTGETEGNLRNLGKFFRRDFAPFGGGKKA